MVFNYLNQAIKNNTEINARIYSMNCDLLIFFPKDGYMSGVQRGKVSQRTLKTAVKIPSYLFEC